MAGSPFRPLPRISSWRRIAAAVWGEPSSPMAFGFDEVEMTAAQDLLPRLREETGEHVTITHLVVKALAAVLAQNPDLNVVLLRRKPHQRKDISIFVQVAIPRGDKAGSADLSGLKLHNVDQKSVAEIAQDLGGRAHRVRKGQDKQLEQTKKLVAKLPTPVLGAALKALTRATFDLGIDLTAIGSEPDPFGSAMVTNCSTFGVNMGLAPLFPLSRTPIILLLGRTEDRPVVRDGEIVIRPMMAVGGTFDHRLLDGFQIGLISRSIKAILEDPDRLRAIAT